MVRRGSLSGRDSVWGHNSTQSEQRGNALTLVIWCGAHVVGHCIVERDK